MKWVVLVLATLAELAMGSSCLSPESLGEALKPDMTVFIGTVVSIERVPEKEKIVTYSIDEALWGVSPEVRSMSVRDGEYPSQVGQKRFVAALRDATGKLHMQPCLGLTFDATHEWAVRFRDAVAKMEPATLSLRVLSEPSYGAIEFAEVEAVRDGKRFEGVTNRKGEVRLEGLPPGDYTIVLTKPHFTSKGPLKISVLPGASGDLLVRMKSSMQLTGRVIDHLGEPVTNLGHMQLIGLHQPDEEFGHTISQSFGTNEEGRFVIAGVMPGIYVLGTNIGDSNHPRSCLVPTVIYPGVRDLERAERIVVREGDEPRDLIFQLPDLGPKRRLIVRVVSEGGQPVAGAFIENGPAWPSTNAAIATKQTGEEGQAEFEVWANAEYSVRARWTGTSKRFGGNAYWESRASRVLPGKEVVSITFRLALDNR